MTGGQVWTSSIQNNQGSSGFQSEWNLHQLTGLKCTDLLLVGLLSLVIDLLYSRCVQGLQRDLEALHLSPINDRQSESKHRLVRFWFIKRREIQISFLSWAHSNGLYMSAVKLSSRRNMTKSSLHRPMALWWTGLVIILLQCNLSSASLIASSEIQMCQRTSAAFEPMFGTGEACKKKFVVSMAFKSGQVNH